MAETAKKVRLEMSLLSMVLAPSKQKSNGVRDELHPLGHGGCLCASDVPMGAKCSEAATEGSGVRLHPDDRRSASDASEGMENQAPR